MKKLNPDGMINHDMIGQNGMAGKNIDYTTTSSRWEACPHKNGTFFTVSFWIFKKRLFFCEDCHVCFDAKIIKILHSINK